MTAGKRDKFILAAILVLGAFARLWRFGAVPCGLNQDEAFAAYEAWALLQSGVDSSLRLSPPMRPGPCCRAGSTARCTPGRSI